MRRDIEWRRSFVQAFDPFRVLSPEECARLYVGDSQRPAGQLHRDLQEQAQCRVLLVGARGSGKTTELIQLFHLLSQEGASHVPVYLDIAEVPQGTGTKAWLPLLAAAARAQRIAWNGANPNLSLESALQAMGVATDLFHKLVPVVQAAGPTWGPMGLVAASTATALGPLARQVADALSSSISREDLEHLTHAIRLEIEATTLAAGRPTALLLDGLDKRASAEDVFDALDDADLLYELPGTLVLTGPMQLRVDPRFAAHLTPGHFEPLPLHNLPVVTREGAPKEEGIRVLLNLFQRRWEQAELGDELLPEVTLRVLAKASSGILREFLVLTRALGRKAAREDAPVFRELTAQVLKDRRHILESTLDSTSWDVLQQLLRTQERPPRHVDQLLFHNTIACYENDSIWYRPNELLIPYLEQRPRAPQA